MIRFTQNAADVTRAQREQWNTLQSLRDHSWGDMTQFAANAGLSPAEAYREMEARSTIILNPVGEFSTLQKAMAVSKSVDLGREAYDYRQISNQTGGVTSMSGQVGVTADQSVPKYAGTPVPFHQHGTYLPFRTKLSADADGYDSVVDQLREAELVVFRRAEAFMWDGDSSIKAKDRVWLGIKSDPSIQQATTALDFLGAGTTSIQMVDELARLVNILRITNNCNGTIDIAVSREVLSRLERTVYSVSESNYGSVKAYVEGLTGVGTIYEDPRLSGGQEMFLASFDQMHGFHSVTGMAMSTFMKTRLQPTDNFEWIKWMAMGFISKNTEQGQKCAMYVQAA